MDENKVGEFIGQVVTDLGAAAAAGSIVIGSRLGLYSALAPHPRRSPTTPAMTCATSPSGCAVRPPAATSRTTRRPRHSR